MKYFILILHLCCVIINTTTTIRCCCLGLSQSAIISGIAAILWFSLVVFDIFEIMRK